MTGLRYLKEAGGQYPDIKTKAIHPPSNLQTIKINNSAWKEEASGGCR